MIKIPETPREAENFFDGKNMRKMMQGDEREELVDAINRAAIVFPFTAVRSDLALTLGGVNREAIKQKILAEIKADSEKYNHFLKVLGKLRAFFPDTELREVVLNNIGQYEFTTFCAKDFLANIFSSEYFRINARKLVEDEWLQKLYVLLFSDAHIQSLPRELQWAIGELIQEPEDKVDVEIGTPKEPGFSCGGLEDNFNAGLESGAGLIRVNRIAIAKLMHRKRPDAKLIDDGLKLSYIFQENRYTKYGQAVWGNFVYTSSKDQHRQIAQAMARGETDVRIENWRIKPVRPLRKPLNSGDFFRGFEENIAD